MEEDQSQWWETMGKLNRAVRVAALALFKEGRFTAHDNHRYNWSGNHRWEIPFSYVCQPPIRFILVTEQEVVRGILNAKDQIDHTLGFFRHIENINIALLRHSMKFIDIASKQIDEEAQAMLSDLRDVRVSDHSTPTSIDKNVSVLCRFQPVCRHPALSDIRCRGPMKMGWIKLFTLNIYRISSKHSIHALSSWSIEASVNREV
jgi:hypothetical protein